MEIKQHKSHNHHDLSSHESSASLSSSVLTSYEPDKIDFYRPFLPHLTKTTTTTTNNSNHNAAVHPLCVNTRATTGAPATTLSSSSCSINTATAAFQFSLIRFPYGYSMMALLCDDVCMTNLLTDPNRLAYLVEFFSTYFFDPDYGYPWPLQTSSSTTVNATDTEDCVSSIDDDDSDNDDEADDDHANGKDSYDHRERQVLYNVGRFFTIAEARTAQLGKPDVSDAAHQMESPPLWYSLSLCMHSCFIAMDEEEEDANAVSRKTRSKDNNLFSHSTVRSTMMKKRRLILHGAKVASPVISSYMACVL
jgi:hypothetical protein